MDTAACCYPETDWQGEQIVYKERQRSAEEHKSIQSFVHSMPGGLSRLKKKEEEKRLWSEQVLSLSWLQTTVLTEQKNE